MVVCFRFAKDKKRYTKTMVDVPRIGDCVKVSEDVMGRVSDVVWDVDETMAEVGVTVFCSKELLLL